MKAFRKLKDNKGASISMALLVLFVALFLSSLALSAAITNIRNAKSSRSNLQGYLAVNSATDMVYNALTNTSFTKQEVVTGEWKANVIGSGINSSYNINDIPEDLRTANNYTKKTADKTNEDINAIPDYYYQSNSYTTKVSDPITVEDESTIPEKYRASAQTVQIEKTASKFEYVPADYQSVAVPSGYDTKYASSKDAIPDAYKDGATVSKTETKYAASLDAVPTDYQSSASKGTCTKESQIPADAKSTGAYKTILNEYTRYYDTSVPASYKSTMVTHSYSSYNYDDIPEKVRGLLTYKTKETTVYYLEDVPQDIRDANLYEKSGTSNRQSLQLNSVPEAIRNKGDYRKDGSWYKWSETKYTYTLYTWNIYTYTDGKVSSYEWYSYNVPTQYKYETPSGYKWYVPGYKYTTTTYSWTETLYSWGNGQVTSYSADYSNPTTNAVMNGTGYMQDIIKKAVEAVEAEGFVFCENYTVETEDMPDVNMKFQMERDDSIYTVTVTISLPDEHDSSKNRFVKTIIVQGAYNTSDWYGNINDSGLTAKPATPPTKTQDSTLSFKAVKLDTEEE